MKIVSILEAKTNLSNLIRMVEDGREEGIVVSRYGKPVARIDKYEDKPIEKRIGIAKGEKLYSDDIDWFDDEITEMFEAVK